MSVIDLSRLQETLAVHANQGQTALLPALHTAQKMYGFIPIQVATEVGRILGVPMAEVYGVIDFYSLLYQQPVGDRVLRVCTDPSCALGGGQAILAEVCRRLDIPPGGTSDDGTITVESSHCLGLCDHAPAVLYGENPIGPVDPTNLENLLYADVTKSISVVDGTIRILTAHCKNGAATNLADYEADGGYDALKISLESTPESVITTIKSSGLVGRGGAAFPTGIKWESAAAAPGDVKYLVCNADESEPGTFKDRVLMENDPHLVLEGMVIAAYAIGAHKGYIYIRGEYPFVFQVMSNAVEDAQKAGYLGENIQKSGFDFNIEMRLGAGAYICGEETALFESIEGRRGFPRIKPPFPTTDGLFGQPTVINNVETLSNVPYILKHGAEAYRQLGTTESPGMKLFCLSGDVNQPGLYELPFGVTLREIIFDLGGGIRDNNTLKAVLLGGAAGSFATPDHLDIPMSFEHLQAAGLPIGSGVVVVFDDTRDIGPVLSQIARFFVHESCGQCFPCRIGTEQLFKIINKINSGNWVLDDLEKMENLCDLMRTTSLCGLGQSAPNPFLSAFKFFRHEMIPYIENESLAEAAQE